MSHALAHVAADPSLIERCAYRMFAAARSANDDRRRARIRAAAIDPDRMETANPGCIAVPFAVRLWLAYLLWLENILRLFDSNAIPDLTAAEGSGLAAMARARSRFARNHSFCPHCGFANARGVARCRLCSQGI